MGKHTDDFIEAFKNAAPLAAIYLGVAILTGLACRGLGVSGTGPLVGMGFLVALGASIYYSAQGYKRGKKDGLQEAKEQKSD